MRSAIRSLLIAAALAASPGRAQLQHARTYDWTFPNGNQVWNWSFENHGEFWNESSLYQGSVPKVEARRKATDVDAVGGAKTGAHVGRVVVSTLPGSEYSLLWSPWLTLKPSTSYTLSFWFQKKDANAPIGPAIYYLAKPSGAAIAPVIGDAYYAATTGWNFYSMHFRVPSDAAKVSFALFSTAGRGQSAVGNFLFDDVVLEEGAFEDIDSKANRGKIGQTVAFGDALGRLPQTAVSLPGGGKLYKGLDYDGFGRPRRSILSVPDESAGGPAFQAGLLDRANALYDGTRYGMPDAGGYAFSEVKYALEPGERIVESTTPGAEWRIGTSHAENSGWFLTGSFTAPSDLSNPPACTDEWACNYRVDWVRNADGEYSARWTDLDLGHLMRSGTRLTEKSGAVRWVYTDYLYHANGKLKSSRTPLGVDGQNTTYSRFTEYDAGGALVSSYDADRGLVKYWYNRSGRLRFTQDALQKGHNTYTYYDYDNRERLFSVGTQRVTTMEPRIYDTDFISTEDKLERIGYIYDHIRGFEARTGIPLAQVMDSNNVRLGRDYGRLVCKYHRNADVSRPDSASRKLVAEFFEYDWQGRVSEVAKYIGPVMDPKMRRQRVYYGYDAADRLTRYQVMQQAYDPMWYRQYEFSYDELGRVRKIIDREGTRVAEFAYTPWGPLASMHLGGSGTNDGTRVDYAYHINGKVREIKATQLPSGKVVFQQILGYEAKVDPASGVPAPLDPQWNGRISQQLVKLTSDLGTGVKPVQLVNYRFDEMGRMLKAQAYANSNSNPLDASERVNFTALSLATDAAYTTELDYDVNSRITGQRTAGVSSADSARYVYKTGKNGLDRVGGRLAAGSTRDMSATGNFTYDGVGRLARDASKGLDATYDWQGMPTRFILGTERLYNYYDADGALAAQVMTSSAAGTGEKRVRGEYDIVLGGRKAREWREAYAADGSTVASSLDLFILPGKDGDVGRAVPNGTAWTNEYYLRNHQGSTMRTVGQDGSFANQTVFNYMPYGDPKVLRKSAAPDQAPAFTGKDYQSFGRLYAFGRRWFDPELGVWMTPDKAVQFSDPYGMGGDPVNYVDPDGDFVIIIVGVVVGAYLGASAANGDYNPLNWDYGSSDTWVGMAVGGAVGGLSGGAISMGMAMGGSTFLGGVLIGAGVGGSTAFGAAAAAQVNRGDFKPLELLAAAGIGAALGAAGGAASFSGAGQLAKTFATTGYEMGRAWLSGEDILRAAAAGLMAGALSGSIDLGNSTYAKLASQSLQTSAQSVARNYAEGRELFGKVNVGIGPATLVVGSDANLMDQWRANRTTLLVHGVGMANAYLPGSGGRVGFDGKNLSFSYNGGVLKTLESQFPDIAAAVGRGQETLAQARDVYDQASGIADNLNDAARAAGGSDLGNVLTLWTLAGGPMGENGFGPLQPGR